MTTTLSDIRFIVERDVQDTLENESIVNWANIAQNDFMLRIFVADDTTLAIDTTTLTYSLSPDIREIRMIRRQSDIDNGINRPYYPVYRFYNGNFDVPVPFADTDTLLIDFYRYLTYFTDIDDEIDLQDRFSPLYTSFIEMRYFRLPSTIVKLGAKEAELRYQDNFSIYTMTKKQVSDAYINDIGIQKPRESGW